MTHTPGPWRHEKDFSVRATNNYEIAHVSHMNYERGGTCEANARLIAAAPDMLEALKWAAEILESYKNQKCGIHIDAIEKARAAIAKATGAA